ncbi:MAG: FHA domain-containing protein [Actinomycetota bacterium]
MSDAVLQVLKLCLLALVYLFLARVVWVVLRELRAEPAALGSAAVPPRTGPSETRSEPAPSPPPTPHRLVLTHADGRTEAIVVSGETTVGRGNGCTVVLVDTFASLVHARITPVGTALRIADLDSTNGTFVNDIRISGPVDLRIGDTIRIGQDRFEVVA